ncbi:hypothetical protein [Microbulbifer epialgicus]|uniref:Adenylosuccinate lyase C-terminal domain-containing protein n=1 Tax=Microbulbifer epialgicus TaxID=393907 RepID=A0ABV4NV61_9GAMM
MKSRQPFANLLKENPEVSANLSPCEVDKMLDPSNYLGLCGEMVDQTLDGQER